MHLESNVNISPFQLPQFIDIMKVKDPFTCASFEDLIKPKVERGVSYFLSLIKEENSHHLYPLDTLYLEEWIINSLQNIKNPYTNNKITDIFYFTIDSSSPNTLKFQGYSNQNINKSESLQLLIDANRVASQKIYEEINFKEALVDANKDITESQYLVGRLYENGKGIDKDPFEAVKYYKLAADKGHAEAQVALGLCYFHGIGIEPNDEIAVNLFIDAWEQKSVRGTIYLALCFLLDRGVKENEKLAVEYFKEAAALAEDPYLPDFYLAFCFASHQEWKPALHHLNAASNSSKRWPQKEIDELLDLMRIDKATLPKTFLNGLSHVLNRNLDGSMIQSDDSQYLRE